MNNKIILLQSEINLCIARSNWWIAYANSPENLKRVVKVGGYGSALTLDHKELIDDAMKTANNHLSNAQKLIDELNLLTE